MKHCSYFTTKLETDKFHFSLMIYLRQYVDLYLGGAVVVLQQLLHPLEQMIPSAESGAGNMHKATGMFTKAQRHSKHFGIIQQAKF